MSDSGIDRRHLEDRDDWRGAVYRVRWLLAGLGVVLALWFALVAAWTWGIRESLRGAFGR